MVLREEGNCDKERVRFKLDPDCFFSPHSLSFSLAIISKRKTNAVMLTEEELAPAAVGKNENESARDSHSSIPDVKPEKHTHADTNFKTITAVAKNSRKEAFVLEICRSK